MAIDSTVVHGSVSFTTYIAGDTITGVTVEIDPYLARFPWRRDDEIEFRLWEEPHHRRREPQTAEFWAALDLRNWRRLAADGDEAARRAAQQFLASRQTAEG